MDAFVRKTLATGAYADLTIKCDDVEAHVHKVIVCTQSDYFATACKPDTFEEGRNGVRSPKASTGVDRDDDIDADDSQAVKLMVDFLYTHDYEAHSQQLPGESSFELTDEANSENATFIPGRGG